MSPFDRKISIKRILSVIVLFICFSVFASSLSSPLKGKWMLVHQSYGKGSANLANIEKPVYLEFSYEGNAISTKIWAGEDKSQALRWPITANDQGPLPSEIIELKLDDTNGTVYAHYHVKPSPKDDLILDIHEDYRIAEEGEALIGKMEVTFVSGESKRGSYTLHRRFERKQ